MANPNLPNLLRRNKTLLRKKVKALTNKVIFKKIESRFPNVRVHLFVPCVKPYFVLANTHNLLHYQDKFIETGIVADENEFHQKIVSKVEAILKVVAAEFRH